MSSFLFSGGSVVTAVAVKIFFGVAAPIGRSADVGRTPHRPQRDRQALQPGVRQGDCRQAVQHVVRGVHDDLGTEVAPGAVPKYVHQLYRVRRVPPFDVLALSPPFRFPDYFGSGDARDKLQYAMGLRARAVAAAGSASSTYELEVAYGVGDCVALMHTLRGSLECLGLE